MLRAMKRPEIPNPDTAGRLARATFSRAFMSDTKWRKLIAAVCAARKDVSCMTVQFLDAADVRQMRFPPGLSCPWPYIDTIEFGPVELRSIEWMEFDADLTDLLDPIGRFSIELRDGRTRTVGYLA